MAFLPSLSSFRVLSRYAKMYNEFVPSAILYGNDIRGEVSHSVSVIRVLFITSNPPGIRYTKKILKDIVLGSIT